MFNFGRPKTAGDWIIHIAGAILAIFLVWWMLRMYVLPDDQIDHLGDDLRTVYPPWALSHYQLQL